MAGVCASAKADPDHDRRMSWFRESRFGMSIHSVDPDVPNNNRIDKGQKEKAPALPDQSGTASVGDFPLARNGAPACVIVTAVSPTPAARLAALELQSHILKMTGVEIPIRHEAEENGGRRGSTAATRRRQGNWAFCPKPSDSRNTSWHFTARISS